MNAAEKAYEQGKAAIAAQNEEARKHMNFAGEERRFTRAEQVVMDLTHNPVRDVPLIQAAIDGAVVEGLEQKRHERLEETATYQSIKAKAEEAVATEMGDLKRQVEELTARAGAAEKQRDDLASEVSAKDKAVRQAEGIILGQDILIKSLRDQVEALRDQAAKQAAADAEKIPPPPPPPVEPVPEPVPEPAVEPVPAPAEEAKPEDEDEKEDDEPSRRKGKRR